VEIDANPNFLQQLQGAKCSPVVALFSIRIAEYPGGSEKVGREDTSDVFGVCHEFTQPYSFSHGSATGVRAHSPLVILKEIDKATPGLHKALTTGQNLADVTLDYYRIDPVTREEAKFFTITLTNARVVSISQITTEIIPSTDFVGNFEQVSFVYQEIEWNWLPDSIVEMDEWRAPGE